jgi:hypothetical protein
VRDKQRQAALQKQYGEDTGDVVWMDRRQG